MRTCLTIINWVIQYIIPTNTYSLGTTITLTDNLTARLIDTPVAKRAKKDTIAAHR